MKRSGGLGSHRTALSSADDNITFECSEVWIRTNFAGGRRDVQLDLSGTTKAAAASIDVLLLRSGAEQEELPALRHATTQSVEECIADANHALPKGARNESSNEATRGTGALPMMWGVALARTARLVTAVRPVSALGEQRDCTCARPGQGALRGVATAAKGVPRIHSRDHERRLLRHERHHTSSADVWRRDICQPLRCGRCWRPSAPSLLQRLSAAAARLASRALRFSARCFLVAAFSSGKTQTSQPCPRSSGAPQPPPPLASSPLERRDHC